ncbi:MAG: nuclear transport factor 2 family protein [Bacteroidales bacterium]|nr:nuclear transport factor 2 family protein [Bacteroidales bacterium]
MKRAIIILAGIIMMGASCTGPEVSKLTPEQLEAEKGKVALVLEKYVIANEKQEIGLVQEIWAPDPDIVVIGTESDEKLIGWDEIRKVMQRQFDSFEETYISVRDQIIKINETGNTAWFSEIVNYNYIYHGEARSYEGLRFTGVLEKKNGDWMIVQSHMSIPGGSGGR